MTTTPEVEEPDAPVSPAGPPRATGRQGNRATFDLPPECSTATTIRIPALDSSFENIGNSDTSFTLDTTSVDPGTYQVEVECEDGSTREAELFVYTQTGAQRGAAKSVVVLGLLGMGSAAGAVGVPALIESDFVSRRGRKETDLDGIDNDEDTDERSH